MTLQSFPLIAVDFNGNEHRLEWSGHSQGDAAKRMLRENSHYKCALNGKESGGSNNPPRKLIASQHGVEADATQTSFGQAFLEAQTTQSLEAARLILNALQKKGLRLEVVLDELNGEQKIVVRPKGVITPEERAEIDENQASIMVLLEAQQKEVPHAVFPAQVPKESQRDIIRKMLPDLPERFERSDLQVALRRWECAEYQDLSEKTSKLDNLLAWCATQGLITRITKGHYQRNLPTKVIDPEPLPVDPTESAPVTNHAAPTAPDDAESLQPPAVIVDNRIDVTQPGAGSAPSLAQALIDLSSELASTPVDESELESIDRKAQDLYEAFEKFTDAVDSLIKKQRANIRARQIFRTQLSSAQSKI